MKRLFFPSQTSLAPNNLKASSNLQQSKNNSLPNLSFNSPTLFQPAKKKRKQNKTTTKYKAYPERDEPRSPPRLAELQSECTAAKSASCALPLSTSALNAFNLATASFREVRRISFPSGSFQDAGLLEPSCFTNKCEALTFSALIFSAVSSCTTRQPHSLTQSLNRSTATKQASLQQKQNHRNDARNPLSFSSLASSFLHLILLPRVCGCVFFLAYGVCGMYPLNEYSITIQLGN